MKKLYIVKDETINGFQDMEVLNYYDDRLIQKGNDVKDFVAKGKNKVV